MLEPGKKQAKPTVYRAKPVALSGQETWGAIWLEITQ